MKTLLILVLLFVAAGGAFLSKPSEQSFRDMIKKSHQAGDQKDLVDYVLHGFKGKSDQFLDSCKFNDHILWTTVECNGKTIYTGAFGTWFGRDFSIQKVTN